MYLIYTKVGAESTGKKVLFYYDGENLVADYWVINSSSATEYSTKAIAENALAKITSKFPNLHAKILYIL